MLSKELRKQFKKALKSGVTVYRIAKDCEVNTQTLYNFKNGKSISSEVTDKLASYLELELKRLDQ